MSVNKYNSERYYDPTAYEAMRKAMGEDYAKTKAAEKAMLIEKEKCEKRKKKLFRPVVFICSPFAGNIEYNVSRACGYSLFAISKNCIPYAPHLLFPQFMDDSDPKDRSIALDMGLRMLERCNELWVFGAKTTVGMSAEIEAAMKRGKRIRYFTDRCEEVQK